jgi:hypothetical protein
MISALDEPNYVPYVLIVSTALTAFGVAMAFIWAFQAVS